MYNCCYDWINTKHRIILSRKVDLESCLKYLNYFSFSTQNRVQSSSPLSQKSPPSVEKFQKFASTILSFPSSKKKKRKIGTHNRKNLNKSATYDPNKTSRLF